MPAWTSRKRGRAVRRQYVTCQSTEVGGCPLRGWKWLDLVQQQPTCKCGCTFPTQVQGVHAGSAGTEPRADEDTIGRKLLADALAAQDADKVAAVRRLFPNLEVEEEKAVAPSSAFGTASRKVQTIARKYEKCIDRIVELRVQLEDSQKSSVQLAFDLSEAQVACEAARLVIVGSNKDPTSSAKAKTQADEQAATIVLQEGEYSGLENDPEVQTILSQWRGAQETLRKQCSEARSILAKKRLAVCKRSRDPTDDAEIDKPQVRPASGVALPPAKMPARGPAEQAASQAAASSVALVSVPTSNDVEMPQSGEADKKEPSDKDEDELRRARL